MSQPAFANSLFTCDDASSLRLSSGARFIRKLPGDRSLEFLHKLYPPITEAELDELPIILGRALPAQYQRLLRWANGGSLFNNCIALFGFVQTLTRSLEIEDQVAISLIWENEDFAVVNPARWDNGWTKIGSAVGWGSSFDLQLHQDGSCAIVGPAGERIVPSLEDCLSLLIGRIGACFGCDGVIDKSYSEVEAALNSLIRTD